MRGGEIELRRADLHDPGDGAAVLELLDHYARDPQVSGRSLAPDVRSRLIESLRRLPTAHVLLAFENGEPAGVLVGILGISTFAAAPLLNIHDLGVRSECRGRGIGTALLRAAERDARELGCTRITLETSSTNRARALYARCGFRRVQEFWKKDLVP